jgi:hypothetical protein
MSGVMDESLSAQRDARSPSLVGGDEVTLPAYELKFLVDEHTAAAILESARAQLQPDPHGEPGDGSYTVTTLYLETPGFDVFHGADELQGAKYRLRRYGRESQVWLEKKIRRAGRVRKRRSPGPSAPWFEDEVRAREFGPALAVAYRRTAFFGRGDHGNFRLTLDRAIVGRARSTWDLDAVTSGTQLESGRVVCELKFLDALPSVFKRIVAEQRLEPANFSKFRRLLVETGVVREGSPGNP